MVRQWQELFHDDRYLQLIFQSQPDFVKLADAYGMTGNVISTEEEAEQVLDEALQLMDRS